ncbi:thioredoxin family protein [Ancylomarina sp. DW003]|nr:thioredoxin family protein [Ancylomarina sp. DW003]MDE5424150.1 thioredoxin family protein [Ancylomarina sp. DW003]
MKLLLFISLFISLSAYSQQEMRLSVEAKDHLSEQFFLQMGNEMGIITLDSTRVKSNGSLFFEWEGESGMYRLTDTNGHVVDFRMEKPDMSFEIRGDFSETELIFDSGSKNNQLQYYISEFDFYKKETNRIAQSFKEAESNNSDSKEISKTYKETQKEFDLLVKDLWSKRSDDWSSQLALSYADILPDLNQKLKTRIFIDKYFEYFDFTDSLLVTSPCFYSKLNRFFNTNEIQSLLKRNEIKEIELMVQHLFWLCEVNKTAQECLVNYLLQTYTKETFSNFYASVVKTYKLANSCEYVMASKHMRSRVANDKNFTIGSKAPDFVLPNCMDVNLESFSKVNSDMTLLVAWSAHCEESVDLLNRIQDLYLDYQNKGLEVVAICIDNNLGAWERFVNDNAYNWINACDKLGLKSEFANVYNIISTPSMFVISPDLKLIAKPITFFQLKNEIKENLD